jgi:hypothetical protein
MIPQKETAAALAQVAPRNSLEKVFRLLSVCEK